MADHTSRVETTYKLVFALPLPTNWTEVYKMSLAMRNELRDRGINPDWDDIVTVEADEDELRYIATIATETKE